MVKGVQIWHMEQKQNNCYSSEVLFKVMHIYDTCIANSVIFDFNVVLNMTCIFYSYRHYCVFCGHTNCVRTCVRNSNMLMDMYLRFFFIQVIDWYNIAQCCSTSVP